MIDLIKGDRAAPNFTELKLDSFLIQLLNLYTQKKKTPKKKQKIKINQPLLDFLIS